MCFDLEVTELEALSLVLLWGLSTDTMSSCNVQCERLCLHSTKLVAFKRGSTVWRKAGSVPDQWQNSRGILLRNRPRIAQSLGGAGIVCDVNVFLNDVTNHRIPVQPWDAVVSAESISLVFSGIFSFVSLSLIRPSHYNLWRWIVLVFLPVRCPLAPLAWVKVKPTERYVSRHVAGRLPSQRHR